MSNSGDSSTEPKLEDVPELSIISGNTSPQNSAETSNQESSDEDIHRRRRRNLAENFEASEESEGDESCRDSEITLETTTNEIKSISITEVESKPTNEIKSEDENTETAKEMQKIEEIPTVSDAHVQKEIFFKTGQKGQTRINNFRNPIDSQMWPRDRLDLPDTSMNFPDRRSYNYHRNRQNDYNQFSKKRNRSFNYQNRGPIQVDSYPSFPSEFTNRSPAGSTSLGDVGNEKNIQLKSDLSVSSSLSEDTKNIDKRESVKVQKSSNYVHAKQETQPDASTMPSRSYYYIDHALMEQISPNAKSNRYMLSPDSGNKIDGLQKPKHSKGINGQYSRKITVTTHFNEKPHQFKSSSSKRYTNMRQNVQSPTNVMNTTQAKSHVESTAISRKVPTIEVSVSNTNSSDISPKPFHKNTSLNQTKTSDLEKNDKFIREIKDISLSDNRRSQSVTPTSKVSPIPPTARGNSSSDSRESSDVKPQTVYPQPTLPPPPVVIAHNPATTAVPQVYPQYHSYDQSYLMQGMYYQPPHIYNQAYFDPNMAMYPTPPSPFQYCYFPQQFIDYQHHPAFYNPHRPSPNDMPSMVGNSVFRGQAPPSSTDTNFRSSNNFTSHSNRSTNYYTNNRYNHPGTNLATPPYGGNVQSGDRIAASHEKTAGT